MADNVTVDNGTGTDYGVASDKVTYSGDADQAVQLVKLVFVEGAEGSKTASDVYVDTVTGGFIGIAYTETGGALNSADSISDGDSGIHHLAVVPAVFNGSTFDRLRGNTGGVFVNGQVAHDIADTGNPVKIGGKGTAAAPTSVTEGDRVNAWYLLNGSQATTLTAAGALIGGDATNGLDVDVTRVTGSVTTIAAGDVAHDSTDSGNPVKIGGRARDLTALSPVSAYNDRVDAALDEHGIQGVTLMREGSMLANTNLADSATLAGDGLIVQAANMVYNGTNWDRQRGDTTNGLDVDVTRLPALVASSANIGDVDVLTLPGITGAAAHASPTSGNPVFIAGRASAVIPTDVGADGDAAGMWTNRNGAQMVSTAPHIGLNSDPWNLVHEGAQYTSAQTSTVLVAGGASEKLVVTKVQIQAYATTAGTAILYFGTGAYSRGTNRAVFDGEFAPSSTSKPGVVLDGPFIAGTNGDDLMVTTTNALSITFSVWYYVIT